MPHVILQSENNQKHMTIAIMGDVNGQPFATREAAQEVVNYMDQGAGVGEVNLVVELYCCPVPPPTDTPCSTPSSHSGSPSSAASDSTSAR